MSYLFRKVSGGLEVCLNEEGATTTLIEAYPMTIEDVAGCKVRLRLNGTHVTCEAESPEVLPPYRCTFYVENGVRVGEGTLSSLPPSNLEDLVGVIRVANNGRL